MDDLSSAPQAVGTRSLDHLRPLLVRGVDARTFLDSQLTRNVPPPGVASLAGYCSPKGRLLATFLCWTDGAAVWLAVSDDIAEGIAKRLRQYVMRARVTIDDASSTHVLGGLGGAHRPEIAILAPWATATDRDRTRVRLPDCDGHRRCLEVRPVAEAPAADADAIDARTWRWQDIRSGLPRITLATQDRFVPQMVNLEALGGVDFKKGCFPGQEVVARSQYLGKLKRRMALATLDARDDVPAPGSDVWSAGPEPCGLVIDAERGDDGRVALLIELPVASFASPDLHIGRDGPTATVEPLPYALPDNEVFVRPRL